MDFLWPNLLLFLGLVPVIAAFYTWVVRRYRFAAPYSSLALIKGMPRCSWLRRHLPFLLFLLALTSLIIAAARPITPEEVLSGRTTIILTLDTSRSMCMRDILPSRLQVAQNVATSFVEQPVLGTQIGIVAFSGFAELAQAPTTNVELLERTIQNLTTGKQTAIGSAILRSLDAIAEVDKTVAPSDETSTFPTSSKQIPPPQYSEEDYVPHIIVLLTDGASNTGPSPIAAAQQAAERGVRIYTIGFGTTRNVVMDCWSLQSEDTLSEPDFQTQPGPGSFGSGADEATLKQIAEMTGGKFYSATSAAELQIVFQELHSYFAMANKTIEVSVFFAAAGVILAMAALILSILWHPLL